MKDLGKAADHRPQTPKRHPSRRLVVLYIVSAVLLPAALWFGFPIAKRMYLNMLGDVLLEGFGPGASDYSVSLINDFKLGRTSSKTRSIVGPSRETGPMSSSQIWVDFDVQELGWDEIYIVCRQGIIDAEPTTKPGWWIVDTVNHKRYGPFTEKEFRDELVRLDIPQISIRPVESFAPQ